MLGGDVCDGDDFRHPALLIDGAQYGAGTPGKKPARRPIARNFGG
jgi:hypothetical protein